MSKAEVRRTKKRLKEREGLVPAVVFKRKRKHRMTGRSITMSSAELAGQKQDLRLPIVNERMGGNGGRGRVHAKPLHRKYVDGGLKLTNGVNVNPALIAAIKGVDDVKAAKKVARIANSWFRKLYGLEEVMMAKEFKVGDEVWWRKKNMVRAGRVVRLKSRKLVIDPEPWDPNEERVVLSVRKVTKGAVPKEHIQPDPRRWRVGRAKEKGGEAKLAEVAVG